MSSISVVIPAYNEELFIENCLKHLTHQLEPADEIIVVDNNCTDRTVEIARQFPEVTVIQEPQQGMIFARNTGMNAAQGEIIARCDADSRPNPDWVKKMKAYFYHHNIAAVSSPICYYDLPLPSLSASVCAGYMNLMNLIQGYPTLLGPNMGVSRTVWQHIKDSVCMNDKQVHEDIDLAIHIAMAGGKTATDWNHSMPTSGRRIAHNPGSFFGEYLLRLISTLRAPHRKP